MFVRIRGKGACPENSQAAVMHIRGFRHTHSSAPPDSFYPLLNYSTGVAHQTTASSSSTATAPAAGVHATPLPVEMRPFRFALFPVGIHAAALTETQAKWMAPRFNSDDNSKVGGNDNTAPASPLTILDSEVARIVWKETWNLYDILYDEVPLLPWTEANSGPAATAVAETVEGELRLLTEDGNTAVKLTSLESLRSNTEDFELASSRGGNHQVVVCPHYYSSAALPEETFKNIQSDVRTNELPSKGPVMVLDLTDLPVAQAGGKVMVNIAWYIAFAAMQPDSSLLRCRAVVVRLPYAAVPTYAQAARAANASASAPTMANAFVEMVDFIGEHITTVRHAMVRELGSKSAKLDHTYAVAPPVLAIGGAPEELSACLQSLLTLGVSGGQTDHTKNTPPSSSNVVVFYGDHLAVGPDGSTLAAHDLNTRKAAEYVAIGGVSACVVSVETVVVPLKALLEGGEEPWDEYTLRERQRLNFCPCCGDCGNEGGSDGADHGHNHNHDSGHHH